MYMYVCTYININIKMYHIMLPYKHRQHNVLPFVLIYIYIYIYIYICVCVYLCLYMYTYIYI